MSTFDAWSSLLDEAEERVDLAVFYWSLLSGDVQPGSNFPSSQMGEQILQKMLTVGKDSILFMLACVIN